VAIESRRKLADDERFATGVAIGIVVCQWWIVEELRMPTRWALPAAATALVAAIVFVSVIPGQAAHMRRLLRLGLVSVLVFANILNLLALTAQAFFDANPGSTELLVTGGVLWVMNVLAFALAYWVIDAGGPEARGALGPLRYDFVFPQQTDDHNAPADWRATFGDYLYLAFTGAIAFGPTDAMPYTRRAKAVMAIEGAIALSILGVVIARAVSLAGN